MASSDVNDYLSETARTIFNHHFMGDNPIYKTEKVNLETIASVKAGGDKPTVVSPTRTSEAPVPIFSNGTDNEGLYGFTAEAQILEESVTVSARGTIGFVCLRSEPYYPIVRLLSATPLDERVSAKYLFLYLDSLRIQGAGTTQQQLTVPMFKKQQIPIPSPEAMENFTSEITPLFTSIVNNKRERDSLAKLRDTLLPKLMSGEIDVTKVKL